MCIQSNLCLITHYLQNFKTVIVYNNKWACKQNTKTWLYSMYKTLNIAGKCSKSFYLWKMKVANELHTPSFHDQPTQTPKKLHMMCQHLPQIREKHVQERPGHFLYLISYIAFNICQYLNSFLTQNSSLKSDFGISPEYQTDGHRSVYDLRGVSEFLENSQAVLKQMLQIGTIHTLTQICTSKRLKTQVLIYFKQWTRICRKHHEHFLHKTSYTFHYIN